MVLAVPGDGSVKSLQHRADGQIDPTVYQLGGGVDVGAFAVDDEIVAAHGDLYFGAVFFRHGGAGVVVPIHGAAKGLHGQAEGHLCAAGGIDEGAAVAVVIGHRGAVDGHADRFLRGLGGKDQQGQEQGKNEKHGPRPCFFSEHNRYTSPI